MDNMRIVRLLELRLSSSQIQNLPATVLAVFTTLAYVSNEITTFQALFLSSKPEIARDPVIQSKARIQKFILSRTLNAKIFEGLFALTHSKELLRQNGLDAVLSASFREIESAIALKDENGYEIAKRLRDKVSNHIIVNEVLKNLQRVATDADKTLYLHRSSGDSFYPIAEDYVFGSILNQIAKEKGSTLDLVIKEWMDWSIKVSSQISNTFEVLALEVCEEYFPDSSFRKISPYVEADLDGGFRKRPLSLFHST